LHSSRVIHSQKVIHRRGVFSYLILDKCKI